MQECTQCGTTILRSKIPGNSQYCHSARLRDQTSLCRTPKLVRNWKLEASSRLAVGLKDKSKPDWAGEDLLSKVVNVAISIKPLYKLMSIMAKRVIIQTATKNGVPWQDRVQEMSHTQEIYDIKEEIEDKTLRYPEYYIKSFHAYDQGNLDWTAAFEVELATLSMGMRTFKDEDLSPEEAQDKLRAGPMKSLQAYREEHQLPDPENILDIGCSVGVSTQYLAQEFPKTQVSGLDLSPHFLAVAEYRERELERSGKINGRQRLKFQHSKGEETGLQSSSYSIVQLGFVIHECPPSAIKNLATEAFRLLKKGGCLLLYDNNPRSKTIQNLPPFLFTLMKSTEPWSDEYYQTDVEGVLREIGFDHVQSEECDHRHRAILALKS